MLYLIARPEIYVSFESEFLKHKNAIGWEFYLKYLALRLLILSGLYLDDCVVPIHLVSIWLLKSVQRFLL